MKLATSDKINKYIVRNELLYRDENGEILLVIPRALQNTITRRAHEQGHFGNFGTLEKWKRCCVKSSGSGMRQKVEKIIATYINCILAERKKQEGFLNVVGKGDIPLDTFHVDHLEPTETI